MGTYFSRHLQVLFATLGEIRRTPLTSINTILVVAITLFLPSILYIGIKSGQQLSQNWQGKPQISIFLNESIGSKEAQLIFEELRLHPSISIAEFITPEQALIEFQTLSGLNYELDFLGKNPLPASIVVMPDDNNSQSDKLLSLKEELSAIGGIESIRLDLDWTDRFNAILNAITRISSLLSGLLIIGLVLIVSNTIKLLILNRRHEIEITKLVGGNNAFVRRPFLYYGMLYGIFGAITALTLLLIAAILIDQPLSQLANLYQKTSLIYALNIREISSIILIGGLIGWLAARWSVSQHLRKIKPQ